MPTGWQPRMPHADARSSVVHRREGAVACKQRRLSRRQPALPAIHGPLRGSACQLHPGPDAELAEHLAQVKRNGWPGR